MRLLPGRPISHSWLWPPVVLRALPWDGMTRQTPAGTTTPVRSAGRRRPPRPERRAQALPEMSPALRSRRPVSRSQAPARATSRLRAAARRRRRASRARTSRGFPARTTRAFPPPGWQPPARPPTRLRTTSKQIGKVPLLTAGQEVELAKRIEAGLFAEDKLADGSGVLRAGQRDRP